MKVTLCTIILFVIFVSVSHAAERDRRLPTGVPSPRSYAECDALQQRWALLAIQASGDHSECLATKHEGEGGGATCSVAHCQSLHDEMNSFGSGQYARMRRAQVNECRRAVASVEEAERKSREQAGREAQAARDAERRRILEEEQRRADHQRRAASASANEAMPPAARRGATDIAGEEQVEQVKRQIEERKRHTEALNELLKAFEAIGGTIPESLNLAKRVLETSIEMGEKWGLAAAEADRDIRAIEQYKLLLCREISDFDSQSICAATIVHKWQLRNVDATLNWYNERSVLRRAIDKWLGNNNEPPSPLRGPSSVNKWSGSDKELIPPQPSSDPAGCDVLRNDVSSKQLMMRDPNEWRALQARCH